MADQEPNLSALCKMADAFLYVEQVKASFRNEEKCKDLLALLKLWLDKMISLPEMIMRVVDLFRGHDKLLRGFNAFLPDGYKVLFAPTNIVVPCKELELLTINLYMRKVKFRLRQHGHCAQDFIDFRIHFDQYKLGFRTSSKVVEIAKPTLRDQPDLLEEFNFFLPFE
ncbi:hypothetical protein L7F22_031245 [Adiantum nelumboides]|nr:hypothetical protein [Adiantum nelumboides]